MLLYVVVGVCYVMLYRWAVMPPHTWVTDVFLWITWCCVVFSLFFAVMMLHTVRQSMNRVMLAEIHAALPEHRVITYFVSMFACVLVLYEADHMWTSMLVGVTGVVNWRVVWCLLVNPAELSDTHDQNDDLLVRAVKSWAKGDFSRVISYAEHMRPTEIEWLIDKIAQDHGEAEGEAARSLLIQNYTI